MKDILHYTKWTFFPQEVVLNKPDFSSVVFRGTERLLNPHFYFVYAASTKVASILVGLFLFFK